MAKKGDRYPNSRSQYPPPLGVSTLEHPEERGSNNGIDMEYRDLLLGPSVGTGWCPGGPSQHVRVGKRDDMLIIPGESDLEIVLPIIYHFLFLEFLSTRFASM